MVATETIVACATPPGKSALACIRLSGPESLRIASSCFNDKSKFASREPGMVGRGIIVDPGSGSRIDDVLSIAYRSPRSFSGEDMVEIFCHGGPVIIEKVIAAFIAAGARYAQRGEFTQRAFLNGKMDLLRAEAMREMIEAETEIGHKNAIYAYFNHKLSTFSDWNKRICELLSLLEADIEFPDEEDISKAKLGDQISTELLAIKQSISDELEKREKIKSIDKGIGVAIVGPKNAGKSSLFNLLIGDEWAIVHRNPGTTRDMLREKIRIHGIDITLIDTAGIGEAKEEIEEIGIKKSWEAIKGCPLAIWVTPADEPATEQEMMIARERDGLGTLGIISKADLADGKAKEVALRGKVNEWVSISLLDTGNREIIAEKIGELLKTVYDAYSAESILINSRQESLARKMRKEIDVAIKQRQSSEIIAHHIISILRLMEEFCGKTTPDDVLKSIFSKFCIGK